MTGAPQRFGARLQAAVETLGPLCVGIDPHAELLADWGLDDDPAGLERFALTCVEALAGHVAVVKPQSAFFERHGARGIAILERVLAELAASPTLALLDAKRGDIGSTMGGYADAYLAPGAPLGVDAITLSPYLGPESLAPAISAAVRAGRGVFLLARTSNPEGATVQLAERDGRSVAQLVVDAAAAHNSGREPLGDVGVVVGATVDHGLDLTAANGPILAPGLGAQGAGPGDIRARFAGVTGLVLPSASRSVLRRPGAAAVRSAARSLCAELEAVRQDWHDRVTRR